MASAASSPEDVVTDTDDDDDVAEEGRGTEGRADGCFLGPICAELPMCGGCAA